MLEIHESNSIVAHNLKRIFDNKNLKQAAVAKKSGFTQQEFSDMMNGRRIIRASDINSILQALKPVGVEANDLFYQEGVESK